MIADLHKRSRKVGNSAEVAQVGTVSANGEAEIGDMIAEAMETVGHEGVITVEEGTSLDTHLDVVEGMQFDRGYSVGVFCDQCGEDDLVELERSVYFTP